MISRWKSVEPFERRDGSEKFEQSTGDEEWSRVRCRVEWVSKVKRKWRIRVVGVIPDVEDAKLTKSKVQMQRFCVSVSDLEGAL